MKKQKKSKRLCGCELNTWNYLGLMSIVIQIGYIFFVYYPILQCEVLYKQCLVA